MLDDVPGEALCCAAAIRLGGALEVLAAKAGLAAGYAEVARGIATISAALGGRVLDDVVVGSAFAANWTLGSRYPSDLPGWAFFRTGLSTLDVVFIATRPGQTSVAAALGLEYALQAAASWPAAAQARSGVATADFEAACQREAEFRLREGGFSALRESAMARAGDYRGLAQALVGMPEEPTM